MFLLSSNHFLKLVMAGALLALAPNTAPMTSN